MTGRSRGPKVASGAPPSPGGPVRGALLVAAILGCAAGIVTTFFGDTFVVRTASMEPTLVGRGGREDRVVVSHLDPRLRRPDRFDLVSFPYPNNHSVRYMKRVVGFGGEQLAVDGGDLWLLEPTEDGPLEAALARGRAAILRKPDAVVDALLPLFPVVPEAAFDDAERCLTQHFVVREEDRGRFSPAGAEVRLAAGPLALARTRGEIRDASYDPPGVASPAPTTPVPGTGQRRTADLSLRVRVRVGGVREADAVAVLELRKSGGATPVRLEIAAGDDGPGLRLRHGDRVLGSTGHRLRPGVPTELRLDDVDGRVRAFVEGVPVLARDLAPAAPTRETPASPNDPGASAAFGGAGADFGFRPTGLFRDLHYVEDGQSRWLIPEGQLVVLGDHSAHSADSRIWRRVAIEVVATGEILEGDAQGVTLEDLLLHERNPWVEYDGRYRFVDDTGRRHDFEDSSAFRVLGTRATPWVPESSVEGRGILVVLPPSRMRWLR